jgi:serine/threonine-protein phosphatase 4 regulatory subunit 2
MEEDGPSVYSELGMDGVLKIVSTPIFTPIAFLHDDARRRSQSRSPPASPLRLHNSLAMGDAPADEPKGLGLVDELDTPAPGHMASKPNPLTATTSSEPPGPATSLDALPSLSERFVKAGDTDGKDGGYKDGASGMEGVKGSEDGKNEDAEVENMVLSQEEDVHT